MQSLRQSTILQSPQADPAAAPFALAIWVGTIGGPTLALDPDPNVSPPSAGRILIVSPKRRGTMALGQGVVRVVCGIVAASSATFQLWTFDGTKNLWVQLGGVFTITPTGAATNTNNGTGASDRMGMQVFAQLTANTLVKAFGYDFV